MKTHTLLLALLMSCSAPKYCQQFIDSPSETISDRANKFKIVWCTEEKVIIVDRWCRSQNIENIDKQLYFVGDSIYLKEMHRGLHLN